MLNNLYCFPCETKLKPVMRILYPDEIITEVCKYMGVPVGRIIGNRRDLALVTARHLIADILYSDKFLNMSLKSIGRKLGGRDHATILHAIRKVSNLCETDKRYREQYRKLYEFLYDSDRYFKYTESYFMYKKQLKVKNVNKNILAKEI